MKFFLFYSIILLFYSCNDVNNPHQSEHEAISGTFRFNPKENEAYLSHDSLHDDWVKTLNILNVELIEEYLEVVTGFPDEFAQKNHLTTDNSDEKLVLSNEKIKADSFLCNLPERVMFSFYIDHEIYQHNLLFHPHISEQKESETVRIYMNSDQFEAIKDELGTPQEFAVRYVGKIDHFNITMYQLLEQSI